MTHKEIADELRAIADREWPMISGRFKELADKLDPQRPAPGTVVWWRYDVTHTWHIGEVSPDGKGVFVGTHWGVDDVTHWEKIEYKPTLILPPGKVVLPLGVAKAIAGEESKYEQNWYTAFAVEARATLAREIARTESGA